MILTFAFTLLFPFLVRAAAPIIEDIVPQDDATTVSLVLYLEIYFDQNVTPGTGFITIKKASDDSTVATFDVTDEGVVTVDGSSAYTSIPANLEYSTDYYILIDAGAFVGEGDEDFAGIADDTTLNFRTRAPIGNPVFDFERASVESDGSEFTSGIGGFGISSDGRYVVFADLDDPSDIFLRDRQEGVTTHITDQGYNSTVFISGNGRFVLFQSDAALAPEDDDEGDTDTYVYDRIEDSFELITVNEGGEGGSVYAFELAISDDGRYVAFGVNARLVPEATSDGNNIYIRDRQEGTTTIIVHGGTKIFGFSSNSFLILSTDVDFDGALDTNSDYDIYMYDLGEEAFTLASITADGGSATGQAFASADISSDHRYVLFGSRALAVTDTPVDGSDVLYLRDTQEGTTEHIVGGDGEAALEGQISDDGRYIVYAFQVSGSNIIEVYRYDRQEDTIVFITEGSDNEEESLDNRNPLFTEDPSVIAFRSNAENLVDGDTNDVMDVFVWDENAQTNDEDPGSGGDENSNGDSGSNKSSHRRSGASSVSVVQGVFSNDVELLGLQRKLIELLKELLFLLSE